MLDMHCQCIDSRYATFASWIAQDSYVIGVERKAMFATRNDASNQILVAGPSAVSRSMDTNPLSRAGLNGTGVTIGVADTGLDFDHCMLWQRPFDWFCFDPLDVSFDGMRSCPFSAFAGTIHVEHSHKYFNLHRNDSPSKQKWRCLQFRHDDELNLFVPFTPRDIQLMVWSSGLLANSDFADFLTLMVDTTQDVPLMSSGR